MKYQALRGTKDILPNETPVWQSIEETIRQIFKRYGFSEIRTPIIEQSELFTRSIGDSSDIVTKEMYTFTDKGDRSITLRPEATASVVRAAVENSLLSKDKITKLYYIGPMFRYERPQAGRQRQFNQAGIELFGTSSYLADIEVIMAGIDLFNALGLQALEVDINSVGCPACRPAYIEKLKKFLSEKIPGLCGDCRKRYEKNPLRVLDCKEESCKKQLQGIPTLKEMLCAECSSHFDNIVKALEKEKINVKINDRLVRGLDYYTKTTFEIVSGELGAQNAVAGGGRYDDLVKELGGPSVPAVGFAVGLERLISVMTAQNILPKEAKPDSIYIAWMGEAAKEKAFEIAIKVRSRGIAVQLSYDEKSLSSQLKAADNLKAKYVLILGEDEMKKGVFTVRNMITNQQEEMKEERVFSLL